MTDSKTVLSRMQELQLMFHEMGAEGMKIRESFLVTFVIEKVPPGWNEYKHFLKHKHKEMSLEELYAKL